MGSIWLPKASKVPVGGPGWHPGELVRIIGWNPEGPIVVYRPKIYDLDKFYPDNEPK